MNDLENSDWRDFRYDNISVTRLGDVAVVRSTLDFTAERRSRFIRNISTTAPLVDVWVRQDGRWLVIRRYVAPLVFCRSCGSDDFGVVLAKAFTSDKGSCLIFFGYKSAS